MSETPTSNEVQKSPSAAKEIPPTHQSLRIWPAVILVAAIILLWNMTGLLEDADFSVIMLVVMGPALAGILIVLWWATFSRATWQEKVIGALAILAAGFAATLFVDQSLQGFPIVVWLIPSGMLAFATALILLFRAPPGIRTTIAVVAMVVGFGYWTLVRGEGMWGGDFTTTRSWRWEPSAEAVFLDNLASRGKAAEGTELPSVEMAQWPGFRGPNRDANVPDITLKTDWDSNPPRELWRTSVGPGWSSFAVAGRRMYTMEQRGEDEAVVCFDTENGKQLWDFVYPSRFYEAMGGVGPRATPTIVDGKLFTLGADGILLRLNPLSGEKIWQNDLKLDADRQPPQWGFSASPLVVANNVIVHAGGANDKGLLAYDVESGKLAWSAASGDHSYSSAQLLTIDGKDYVAMVSNTGLTLNHSVDGAVEVEHQWQSMGYRTLQPLLVDGHDIVMGSGMGEGARRISFTSSDGKFSTSEDWTSVEMESDFNDFVAYKGNLYGFDRNIFTCIDLETGQRRWKKGRYGTGQVLLLSDSGQLLVTSEKGFLVLLNASPEKLDEVARIKMFDGKTWNHPALVGNRLYMRNAEEAVCYEMPTEAVELPTDGT